MHLAVIVPCYNEEKLLPFFLNHYTQFCDHITFFDGGSTDASHEIITSYMGQSACEIELRITQSKGIIDIFDPTDPTFTRNPFISLHYIRSHAWRTLAVQPVDWLLVVDCDEFLWHPQGVRNILAASPPSQGEMAATVLQMVAMSFPASADHKLHELVCGGWVDPAPASTKCVVFKPSVAHYEFKELEESRCMPAVDGLLLLHYARLGFEYFRGKSAQKLQRLSNYNKAKNLSFHFGPWANMMRSQFESLFLHPTFIPNIHDKDVGLFLKTVQDIATASDLLYGNTFPSRATEHVSTLQGLHETLRNLQQAMHQRLNLRHVE